MSGNKKLKKEILRLINKYGIFNERKFIKNEYRQEFVKDLMNIYKKYKAKNK